MLNNLHNIDEIEEFFKQSYEQSNGKIHRAQLYGMAFNMQEHQNKIKDIEKLIESKFRNIINTTIISDDIAIVEAKSKLGTGEEINFYPVVMGKFHNEVAMSFDEALITAIVRKYTNSTSFTPAIYNMLRMDLRK